MACNGVGTPRLLLNSSSKQNPNGLSNSSGLVGKNLMFHPYAIVNGYYPEEDIDYSLGSSGNILIVQEFYETDPARDFLRGYSFQMNRSSSAALTALGAGSPTVVPWGDSHHNEFKKRFRRYTTMAVISEDLPELHNRVEIVSGNSNTLPIPKIYYKTSENTKKLLNHGIGKAEALLKEAGCVETTTIPLLRSGGWH